MTYTKDNEQVKKTNRYNCVIRPPVSEFSAREKTMVTVKLIILGPNYGQIPTDKIQSKLNRTGANLIQQVYSDHIKLLSSLAGWLGTGIIHFSGDILGIQFPVVTTNCERVIRDELCLTDSFQ